MYKTLSIILPTYNGKDRIQKTIESVVSQSFLDWELVIIDDGSSLDPSDIIEEYQKRDSRIIFLKNDNNLGIQKTLNRGIAFSNGKYIARIDDDDIWIDDKKLEKQISFLEQNKDYVLVGSSVLVKNDEAKDVYQRKMPLTDKDIRKKILFKNCFVHSSVVFRRDAGLLFFYDEDSSKKHIEDYDLWLRMGLLGKFANIEDFCVCFSEREGSISSQKKKEQLQKDILLIKDYKNKYPNYFRAYIFRKLIVYLFDFFNFLPKSFQKIFIKLYKLS